MAARRNNVISITLRQVLMSNFLIRSATSQIVAQLSSRGLLDPVPDLIYFYNCESAGNRNRDLLVSSQTR